MSEMIVKRGVNEAYREGLWLAKNHMYWQESRNGRVYRFPGPVLTEILVPQKRVLISPLRDANPFFHFMEAMWMLAGRRDVEFVAQFNSHISTFSDDGVNFHGAYGHRWRNWFHTDQLKEVIKTLLYDPISRRCVLQMWDCDFDLGKQGKDYPCNTHIYFDPSPRGLNMTVCNRSNDIIWGLYGANFVHMSFLHEFVALSVGMELGRMYTLSNNFHYYPGNLKHSIDDLYDDAIGWSDWYDISGFDICPLFYQPEESEQFLADVEQFCDNPAAIRLYPSPFLAGVAVPMYQAWQCHKNKMYPEALKYCEKIEARDWAAACRMWIERRMK